MKHKLNLRTPILSVPAFIPLYDDTGNERTDMNVRSTELRRLKPA